jgi:O-antigen/teichoic acid export membrane protein
LLPVDSGDRWVLITAGISLFFRPFETLNIWFHSQTNSKYSVYARSGASLIISIVNLALIACSASIILFSITYSLEIALTALILCIIYSRTGGHISAWRANCQKAKKLLSQSWILILSGFFSLVYLKVDQIMLRWMIGAAEVGIYSVAVNLSEVWYFLPTAITLSVYPTLLEEKRNHEDGYLSKIQKTFDVLFLLSLSVALMVSVVAKPSIQLLYGDAFLKSSYVLMIHIWAGVFIFMRALISRIILIENLLVFSLMTHLAGAIVNVVLNLLLINKYASYGAAVATLLAYATASYFSLFFHLRTRPYAIMMSLSILAPVRLLRKLIGRT